MGDKFPKHIYHFIVCIGALIARRESECWAIEALGAPQVGDRTEKELIQAFVDKIAELKPASSKVMCFQFCFLRWVTCARTTG
jgi:hypothetical protein